MDKYKLSYHINKDPEVKFNCNCDPIPTSCDVEITAPVELWNKFRNGEVLMDPIDIGCDKEPYDKNLDVDCIFYNKKDCEDYSEFRKGYWLNNFGDGVLNSYEGNSYFNFNTTSIKGNMETVRVTVID